MSGPSRAPQPVEAMIELAFIDAENAESLAIPAASQASMPLEERALDKLVGYRKSREQVLDFCPAADIFFDLRDELGANKTRFNSEANAEVGESPEIALAAALVGVALTPENNTLAAKRLAEIRRAQQGAIERLLGSFNTEGGA